MHLQAPKPGAHLAPVASVDHGNSLLAGERVDVDLVGVAAAMALLFRLRQLRQQHVVALLQRRRRYVQISLFNESAMHTTAYVAPETKVETKQHVIYLVAMETQTATVIKSIITDRSKV